MTDDVLKKWAPALAAMAKGPDGSQPTPYADKVEVRGARGIEPVRNVGPRSAATYDVVKASRGENPWGTRGEELPKCEHCKKILIHCKCENKEIKK